MIKSLLSNVGITEAPASWERHYMEAVRDMPERIPFIEDDYLLRVRPPMLLTELQVEWIREAMKAIRDSEPLRQLAWLWHALCFRKVDTAGIAAWPIPAVPGDDSGKRLEAFPVVVLLSGFDRAMALYRERRIPESVIQDLFYPCLHNCLTAYEARYGTPGLGMMYMSWLQHYFNARLYRIGNLNFEMRTFAQPLRVYRHIDDGRLLALSEHGVAFLGDGRVSGTNGITDEEQGWTAELEESETHIRGCPIHPHGYAERTPVTLDKREWQLALARGHQVLSIHIPRSVAFTRDACRESFNAAMDFFAQYFPDFHYSAFVCDSWLLDPQLRLLLDESSNIVQFQRWFHLYPVKSDDNGLFTFVFQCDRCDAAQLPEQTSLQRSIKRFMLSGGRLHRAGGFVFPPFTDK